MRFVVLKFGGTSVARRARWAVIADRARACLDEGARPVIVCSAVSGVSDLLSRLLPAATRGEHDEILDALREKHGALAAELGVSDDICDGTLSELERIARGVSLIGEHTPRLTARVMAQGELMSTRLGHAWLVAQGLSAAWVDARSLMTAHAGRDRSAEQRYLSAAVPFEHDPAVAARLRERDEDIVLTQGFIAASPEGETVLLGRGGSDTSATTIAAMIGAVRCEIWTDVPGMFSANPRLVPAARLLQSLSYDEAQEIAATGAKVLHPACVAPVRAAGIPLHVRSTPHPDLPGTVIGEGATGPGSVKAISSRDNLILVVMETVGMWLQVGFLADVFACFKRWGVSVDLVTTSESNVTVSLDAAANAIGEDTLAGLVSSLSAYCRPRLVRGCASLSVVGRNIRSVLHELTPVFELFEENKVYMLSQAASDLNLTVVVEQAQVARLTRKLHARLFAHRGASDTFGPTWTALFEDEDLAPEATVDAMPRWWQARRDELLALAAEGTPTYVYDAATVEARVAEVAGLQSVDRALFAIKANPHPDLMRIAFEAGMGFECVSPGEVRRVRELFPDLPRDRILYTPNFAPRDDYAAGFALDATVTLDNLYPLERWPDLFRDREVFVRIDPGKGRGHHAHVKTAGAASKFGVSLDLVPDLVALAQDAGCRIVGLHAHAGSGIRTAHNWREIGARLADLTRLLPDVRVLDVGGGLGIPEKPGIDRLDLAAVDAELAEVRAAWPHLSIWMEPGRYIVAEAGVLLARVTQRKDKSIIRYVGVDAGMHSLIRPALYGAYHHIVNLTQIDAPAEETVNVVGPICESGDVLGRERRLPRAEEGDVLLIATAGAYGRVMASEYNLRGLPREVILR